MRQLFILRGLPGSGKSTTLEQAGLKDLTISTDALRLQVASPVMLASGKTAISQDINTLIWPHLFSMLEERMKRGDTSVVDAVHPKVSDFEPYRKLARRYGYDLYCLDFTSVPQDYLMWANEGRPEHRIVPDAAIRRMQDLITRSADLPKDIRVITVKSDRSHLRELRSILVPEVADLSHWSEVVIIGDLQGCLTPLKQALGADGLRDDTFYVFVGDYCDRGEENAAVIKWLHRHAVGRDNVVLLRGNHELHLEREVAGLEPVSEEFASFTKKDFSLHGVGHSELRAIVSSLRDVFYYRRGDEKVMVSHGGLPTVPEQPWMLPSSQFVKGVGYYQQDVDTTFSELAPAGWYQVHGHRNSSGLPVRASERSFNLEGSVEFGGNLRIVRHNNEGFHPMESRNRIVRPFMKRLHRSGTLVPSWMQREAAVVEQDRFLPAADLQALRAHPGVRERQSESYPHVSSLSFTKDIFYKKAWDDVVNRARGLFIHRDTGEIVARSYDKFFTVGENNTMGLDALRERLVFPLRGMMKENGFIGITGYDRSTDTLFTSSKSTPDGKFADMFRRVLGDTLGEHKLDELRMMVRDYDASFLFEAIDPVGDPHMVEYERAEPVLLDVVHRSAEFRRLPTEDVHRLGRELGVRSAEKRLEFRNWEAFEGWYRRASTDMSKTYEGLVFTDARGEMFKTKTPFYSFWKLMRGTKDAILRERQGGRRPVSRESMGPFLQTRGLEFLTERADAFKEWAFQQPDEVLEQNIIAIRKMYEAGPALDAAPVLSGKMV